MPSLYFSSALKMSEIQITMMIPIINSAQSGFRRKINGSIKAANNVDNERQDKAIETLETLMDWKKNNQ